MKYLLQLYQKQKLQDAGYGGATINAPLVTMSAFGTAQVAGTIDLAAGESNAFNSGEFGANAILASTPLLGAAAGAGVGYAMTPSKEDALKDLKKNAKEEAMKAQKTGDDPNAGTKKYAEYMKQGNAKYDSFVPGSNVSVAQVANMRRGAAIGAAAMLVPALVSMRDQPKLVDNAQSLM